VKEFLSVEARIILISALLVIAAVGYIRFGWRRSKRIDQR
jgi:hypothetical protein